MKNLTQLTHKKKAQTIHKALKNALNMMSSKKRKHKKKHRIRKRQASSVVEDYDEYDDYDDDDDQTDVPLANQTVVPKACKCESCKAWPKKCNLEKNKHFRNITGQCNNLKNR